MSIRAAGAVRPPAAPPVRVAGGGRRRTSVRWEQVHEEVCLWTWVARLATRAMRGLTGLHRSGPRECESPSPGAEARGLVSADPASPTGVDPHQGRGQVSLSSSTHPSVGPGQGPAISAPKTRAFSLAGSPCSAHTRPLLPPLCKGPWSPVGSGAASRLHCISPRAAATEKPHWVNSGHKEASTEQPPCLLL